MIRLVMQVVERLGQRAGESEARRRARAMVSYSAIHGLANLSLMKILPESEARALALEVLEHVKRMSNPDKYGSWESIPSVIAPSETVKLSSIE